MSHSPKASEKHLFDDPCCMEKSVLDQWLPVEDEEISDLRPWIGIFLNRGYFRSGLGFSSDRLTCGFSAFFCFLGHTKKALLKNKN